MELNKHNYFSLEADKEYFSVSQFKAFRECEAKTMSKLNGEWIDGENEAFLLGSYVHAWNEGTLEEFKDSHPEMYSSKGATKGQLKSNFLIGNKMIKTLANDPLITKVRQGEKEVIMTANLFGALWKIMIDIYNPVMKVFVDLKTCREIRKKYWNETLSIKQNFVEYYDYLLQMAVYAEVIGLNTGEVDYYQPHIIAVSKEAEPDKEIILIGTDFIKDKLLEVESRMDRFIKVKNGLEKPTRCEKCDYCRSTKQLNRIIHYTDL
ncbi:PD-(D/E)XK nuclease-like domain-containing protein [uncultured Clostridium sp.]|uniref:PD-(D/E)XK nuclease-like domain-containing protein n=1 Tax=uncultured Clostridium sp. TaxID=59620 RepID=UPI0028E81AD8|nr:PD-(D/E)XK nuclease-like domain-containing protein [uncultured Clostridium sp.]